MNDAELESARQAQRGESYLELREALLDKERWQTVQLMGIVDKLYCDRIVLVERIVHDEGAWTARTGRVTVLAKERARLNDVDCRISSAQHQIKWRQEVVHPIRPQQQRAASARREPTLVDPLTAQGASNAGDHRQQQQPHQPQQPRGEEWKYEEITREKREKQTEREEEQAEELVGEQTSRSDDDSSAEDGRRQGALNLPPPIEKSSPIEPVCWVSPGAQEQVASPARHVETHPLVTKVTPSYAKENVDEEMVACSGRGFLGEEHGVSAEEERMVDRGKGGGDRGDAADGVGTGEEQENQPLPPPLPPPMPPPPPPPAVSMRVDPNAGQRALVVESHLVLAHRALESYEKRKQEEEEEQEEEEGEDADNDQQQQQGSK